MATNLESKPPITNPAPPQLLAGHIAVEVDFEETHVLILRKLRDGVS